MPNRISQSLKKCGNSALPQKDQQQQQTDKEVELLKLLLLSYWILHQDIKLIKRQENATWCILSLV